MRICISATGKTLHDAMDPRFGRATWFIFADTVTGEYEVYDNNSEQAGGGVGVSSGQLMADRKVEAVITGNVGPNAMNVLKGAGISMYKGNPGSVKANMDSFIAGKLEMIVSSGPSHSGMDRR